MTARRVVGGNRRGMPKTLIAGWNQIIVSVVLRQLVSIFATIIGFYKGF